MKTLKKQEFPYIPERRASMMIVSEDMPAPMADALQSLVPKIIRLPALDSLPRPVCSHPDMQLVIPVEGVVIHAPNMEARIVEMIKSAGFLTIPGEKCPYGKYPSDIPYNAAIVGKRAFLNAKYADVQLLEWLKRSGVSISHVNQGYAKCSTLIVNDDAIITSDNGIFNAARVQNIDVLFLPPQKKIVIEGFDYGFIGGAAGLISCSELAVAGGFDNLDASEDIGKFLGKYGVSPVSLCPGNVLDLGSLIPLCSV